MILHRNNQSKPHTTLTIGRTPQSDSSGPAYSSGVDGNGDREASSCNGTRAFPTSTFLATIRICVTAIASWTRGLSVVDVHGSVVNVVAVAGFHVEITSSRCVSGSKGRVVPRR
jgi:hypothetical protein